MRSKLNCSIPSTGMARSTRLCSIVAVAPRRVLHYVENNAELKSGDLILIDAGCELNGYASDIT